MNDLKDALRSRDVLRKNTIRMALAALKNARVEKNADLIEGETIAVLRKEVRQRQDSIVEFAKGGREDLVAQESAEIGILEGYLPRMLDRDEILTLAREAIAETSASGPKQMGQVMRALMPRVQGRADGRMVNEIVKELLANA
jgi:hypothetical protein